MITSCLNNMFYVVFSSELGYFSEDGRERETAVQRVEKLETWLLWKVI